jgi:hypothetical protein
MYAHKYPKLQVPLSLELAINTRVFCVSFSIISIHAEELKHLSLLLRAEERLADVRASKTHVGGLLQLEHGVHGREVGTGALKVSDDLDVDVGF